MALAPATATGQPTGVQPWPRSPQLEDVFAPEGLCVAGRQGIWLEFRVHKYEEGGSMGKEARVALLLSGTACLMAVMVDWIISELQ